MSKSHSNSSGGIGFCSLLTLLFIGLKLSGFIDWSWWWVLSPSIISISIVVIILIVIILVEAGENNEMKAPLSTVRKSKFQERMHHYKKEMEGK